jgi:hypothetical protein
VIGHGRSVGILSNTSWIALAGGGDPGVLEFVGAYREVVFWRPSNDRGCLLNDCGVAFVPAYVNTFFHFLWDSLPWAFAFEGVSEDAVLVSMQIPTTRCPKEELHSLAVAAWRGRVIQLWPGQAVYGDQIHVLQARVHGRYSGRLTKIVRERSLRSWGLDATGPGRDGILRNKPVGKARHIVNFEDLGNRLQGALPSLTWWYLNMSLGFRATAEVMTKTRVLVAPLGSHVAGVMWMPRGGVLCEFCCGDKTWEHQVVMIPCVGTYVYCRLAGMSVYDANHPGVLSTQLLDELVPAISILARSSL